MSSSSSSSSISSTSDDPLSATSRMIAPKLVSVTQYSAWRLAMENYLVQRQLSDVLTIEFNDQSWKILCELTDRFSNRLNESYLPDWVLLQHSRLSYLWLNKR